ncbi:MAG: glycosyltransferase [Muribaculaceae bacterium]|nr:glycosyltransferase [Muribaculaceae bacterium]
MKPRVLIAMHYLEIGGAETALIGMLRAWPYDTADVDLFLYSHRGELMTHIPGGVNLLPEMKPYTLIETPAAGVIRSGRLDIALARWKARHDARRFFLTHRPPNHDAAVGYMGRYITPFLPRINPGVTYDLAISFLAPHDIVLRKVHARRKLCWIHTDYTRVGHNAALEHPVWGAYDNIISISPDVTHSFLKVHPGLDARIVEIANMLDPVLIRSRAEAFTPAEFAPGFNILSVGRFTDAKNFESIPSIMKRMLEDSPRKDLHWHIIGYGGGEHLIREVIMREGMERHVHIIGKRDNPYPYIKHCDLYVQPSRFEGRSVTVREAQMLGRPVVITDYPTAHSQLSDGVDGLIAPLDTPRLASSLVGVINSPATLGRLAAECAARDYSDSSEINKIISLIPS